MSWTKDEEDWLKANYPLLGKKKCAEILGKSDPSVRMKTFRLGLKQNRDSDFFNDWQSRAANSKVGKKRPDQAEVLKKTHRDGKLIRTKEQNIKMGIRSKEWIAKNGHPRGMLGKKHSSESLKTFSEHTIKMWADPDSKFNTQEHRQRLSDRMSLLQRSGDSKLRQGYSRGKMGRRADLGDQFFRSSWEANYARYLNFLIRKNNIHRWEFEPDTFWFEEIKRGTRSYLPDFKIWEREDSTPYYVEVKGWMDAKSKTKLSRMAKYYPDIKVVVFGAKEYRELKKKLAGIIKHWE